MSQKCWQCKSRQDLTYFGSSKVYECTSCTVSISTALGLLEGTNGKAQKQTRKKIIRSQVIKRLRKAA